MEFIIVVLFLCSIVGVLLIYIKEQLVKSNTQYQTQYMIQKQEQTLQEQLVQKVDFFLNHSKYLHQIGHFKNQPVYQFIYGPNYVYEFNGFMEKQAIRFGVNERELCFKQMLYARVENPTEFFKLFNSIAKKSEAPIAAP